MKLFRYSCRHCGHRFESEEKENMECPQCFWSTSVHPDSPDSEPVPKIRSKKTSVKPAGPRNKVILIAGLVVVVALAALFILIRKKTTPSRYNVHESFVVITQPVEESPSGTEQVLNEEDNLVLFREIEVSAKRQVGKDERRILNANINFSTGLTEKLPYQVWSLENFKEMVAEQEKFYRIPLTRSYKKKINQHLEETYLQGKTYFEKGDLLLARNLWVRSLAFPIYANDLKKHRGVVLTMIRPFINDTLSKIGSINTTLAERQIRDDEARLSQRYQEFRRVLDAEKWTQAYRLAEDLESRIEELLNPGSFTAQAPAYPAYVHEVDEGIRAALFDILNPPQPARADYELMRRDLRAKKKVVESFMPEWLESIKTGYARALVFINGRRWGEAIRELESIQYPDALKKDAQEKINILRKFQEANT